ncbi:MAG TPA: AraC family transcriptional regulator [Acidimicrobiales bacterium]
MGRVRPPEFVDAWDPGVAGVREVFHARFIDHAYPQHTHDAWTVLLLDDGAVRYALDRHDHGVSPSAVAVLPPHVPHDGRPATSRGFAKRVLYLDPAVVGEHLVGRAVDRPTIVDPDLSRSLGALHGAIRARASVLEADTRLALVAERLAAHLAGTPDERAGAHHDPAAAGDRGRAALAAAVRDLLDADPGAPHTLAALAAGVGASPTHLVRSFTTRFGLPPHAYLLGRRIDAARRLLLEGRPAAEVAVTVGFHDQAHLTRHFRRHVGTTPGRYGRGARRPAV